MTTKRCEEKEEMYNQFFDSNKYETTIAFAFKDSSSQGVRSERIAFKDSSFQGVRSERNGAKIVLLIFQKNMQAHKATSNEKACQRLKSSC